MIDREFTCLVELSDVDGVNRLAKSVIAVGHLRAISATEVVFFNGSLFLAPRARE